MEKNNDTVMKKRGRPRKNYTESLKVVDKTVDTGEAINREIILRMPLFNTTGNIVNDTTDVNDSYDNTLDDSENMLLTDGNSISEKESSDDNNINIANLINELRAKDKIIKQMKNEISEMKSAMPVKYTIGRETKVKTMNVSFIDNTTGKTLICDKTDIVCWWCTYMFDTLPCFIPEKFNDGKFYVFGCFCSFSCAMAYNLSLNDYRVFDRVSLINKLYHTITNNTGEITIAPQREILDKFGGIITIDEFRNGHNTMITKEYRLLLPPMISILPNIEMKTKDIIKDTKNGGNNSKSFNIMDTVGIKETMKKKKKN